MWLKNVNVAIILCDAQFFVATQQSDLPDQDLPDQDLPNQDLPNQAVAARRAPTQIGEKEFPG